jgi:hypothetical protein
MRFWKGNKIDGEFEADIVEVAEQFVAAVFTSPSSKLLLKFHNWPLDRTLRDWLTDPVGFNSTWDDHHAYDDLIEAVRVQLRLREEALDPAPILTGRTPGLIGGK